MVISIDPGLKGAIAAKHENGKIEVFNIPIRDKRVDFKSTLKLLKSLKQENKGQFIAVIERAKAMAMGSTYAFYYGYDFRSLEMAAILAGFKIIMIEPHIWTKEMHQNTPKDLKPKARSLMVIQNEYSELIPLVPISKKAKNLDDGVIDALLILKYAERVLSLSI